jgi:hypothetical protein
MDTYPIIYKNPNIIEFIESYSSINPININPHANFIEFYLNAPEIEKYWLSINSSNKAVEVLMQNPFLINVNGLACNKNPKIGPLLESSMRLFTESTWELLCASHNPTSLAFIKKHSKKIYWSTMSSNECNEAIDILEENPGKIDWWSLCKNKNPRAIKMIEDNIAKIKIEALSSNPNAFHIISQNLDKISPHWLSKNPNPEVIKILMEYPDLIDFDSLLINPAAISYIGKKLQELTPIEIIRLSENPQCIRLIQQLLDAGMIDEEDMESIASRMVMLESVYELDYQAMSKIRSRIIYPELVKKTFSLSLKGKDGVVFRERRNSI